MALFRRILISLLTLTLLPLASALTPLPELQDRIVTAIDDNHTIVLSGNQHPLIRISTDLGVLPQEQLMTGLVLVLQPTVQQQLDLNALLDAQYNPESPLYHAWVTPEQYGQRFGISNHDLDRIQNWLEAHGLTVEEIPADRSMILFRGSSTQVAETFRTSFHSYQFQGKLHIANATEISIPSALNGVIAGVSTLNDFRRTPMHSSSQLQASPEYSSGSTHYLAPADFATIYNLSPLYSSGTNGSGETIAVVGRTNINLSDVTKFRSTLGLPTNNPTIVVNGTNPGILNADEQGEATLDTEWSGAVAPNATIKLVVSASTATTDGVDLSAQYIVNNNLAPIMTTSFGSCEASMGTAENAFYNALWKQAASQGITVLVSSGDSGAAGCDASSASTSTLGKGVNGLCSTPYSTCVGGTEFLEGSTPSLYWSSTTNPITLGSALSYIPEGAWNESGAVSGGSELWSTGGGASLLYTKPTWQSGTGVPNDKMRDVPDVSLSAAAHDGYIVEMNGGLYVFSGTSAASPSMAGILALVAEKSGARLGNVNPVFYSIANSLTSTNASAFHDVTTGSNSVPGLIGFTAQKGYDQTTGLGSVNAAALATAWIAATAPASFALASTASALSVSVGSSATLKLSAVGANGFASSVALTNTALSGFTVSFSPASISTTTTSTVTITAASTVKPGSYALTLNGVSGSLNSSITVAITVPVPPSFTLASTASALSVSVGSSATLKLSAVGANGFASSVALTNTALSGFTVSFSPASISTTTTSTVTITAASTVKPGSYTLTLNGVSGSLTSSFPVTVTVTPAPSFTLSASASALTIPSGSSTTVKLTALGANGFVGTIALANPSSSGFSISYQPASLSVVVNSSAEGTTTSTVTIAVASTLSPGNYTLTFNGTSGVLKQSLSLSITIQAPAVLKASASTGAVSLSAGASTTITITTIASGGFGSAVTLTIGGLPTGVTASFSPAVIALPGNGTSKLTLTATKTGAKWSGTFTVTATGGNLSSSIPISLQVLQSCAQASSQQL
jgi:subtilase family serine protease